MLNVREKKNEFFVCFYITVRVDGITHKDIKWNKKLFFSIWKVPITIGNSYLICL